MLSSYAVSAIRTGVPALIGWVIAWLVARGVDVPAEARDWSVGFLTFIFLMAYYLIVRALEKQNPKLGWLLGVPVAPVYPTPPGGMTADNLPEQPSTPPTTPPVKPV